MNTQGIVKMMQEVSNAAIDAKEELCRLDGFVGDGDHGFTVERGFKAVREMLETETFGSPKAVLDAVGEELADTMGGAIGLIIGGLFTGGAEAIEDKDTFDVEDMRTFLAAGLEEIKMVGGATEGDCTLIDALSPASSAFADAAAAGQDLSACMEKAAAAADGGAKATADMVAKKGRAKFLREKSLGYIDAGSVTMATIIRAMSEYVKNQKA